MFGSAPLIFEEWHTSGEEVSGRVPSISQTSISEICHVIFGYTKMESEPTTEHSQHYKQRV